MARGFALKVLLFAVGITAVWNRWLYRELIDGVTLTARMAAGDSSRDTLFRVYSRAVDPAPPGRGAGGARSGGGASPDDDVPFHISELVPPVVLDGLRAAWAGLVAQVPPSSATLQLEDWRRRRSEFSVERTSCNSRGTAGGKLLATQVAKGANVTVEVHAVYGHDGTVLYPRSPRRAAQEHPQVLPIRFMEGDAVYGVDKAVEAAFAAAPAEGLAAGCHVIARFGSDNGFGSKGYWKWRVLPYEPLAVDIAIVDGPAAALASSGPA
eukprot:CAMPEP_0174844340 /NCGR_PEP_ID=MMETSP1114-20130205/11042_1 /TAXON_ID=312471 /ORGANISM="Neobodo designis, Strain CCAP 1951/1" /LENGTH=266 /DNA_ID=CAMNT_0016078577 /DNA_START=39 /DNA_END=836 /DNA_ORIENTATION=+